MLKAGALYFSIVLSFMIAVISASVILLAAHYRNNYLKEKRFRHLNLNLESGKAMLLSDLFFSGQKALDLYGDQMDSILIQKQSWGIFEIGWVKSFISNDTLSKAFMLGKVTEQDQVALYLIDEDRPLSVNGSTRVNGNAFAPKSGIKKSFVEGKAFDGDNIVLGSIRHSERKLPALDSGLIKKLSENLEKSITHLPVFEGNDIEQSFYLDNKAYKLKPNYRIRNKIKGNIILYSDTTVVLTAESELNGIQIYAPHIKVENSFKGNCQLFAKDSISIGKDVYFTYPSCLGIIRTKKSADFPEMKVGENLKFEGAIFSYETKHSPLETGIIICKNARISGEVYVAGAFQLSKGFQLKGKVSSKRILMQTDRNLYQNILIDVDLDRKSRSKYYLSSKLFAPFTENKVLRWLD